MSNPNDRLITDAAQVLGSISEAMTQARDTRAKYQALTGSASVERERITVVVNASGSIIRVVFADDVDDLTYRQIAQATLQAAQRAAADVKRKKEELLAPLRAARAAIPQLSDLVEGLPAMRGLTTRAQDAPLTPPSERDHVSAATEFEDSVEYRQHRRSTFDR